VGGGNTLLSTVELPEKIGLYEIVGGNEQNKLILRHGFTDLKKKNSYIQFLGIRRVM
jgi:hypothetical protein